MITVLLFATLRDLAGSGRVTLDAAGTVADVRAALGEQLPALAPHLAAAVCAVNREFAFPADPVRPGDEVAFFPPVSGGAPWPSVARLADAPFSTDALIGEVTRPETGAVCVFSGVVRGRTTAERAAGQGGTAETVYLDYEAYEVMAVAKMGQVIAEIRERFPGVQGVAVVQRVGRLAVGENTIAIACASGHRDEGCFEAARYGIDRLKAIVPVWKRETGPDGATWIEGAYRPTPDDRAPQAW